MKLKESILDILFPPKCPFCGRVMVSSELWLCPECAAALPRTQGRTGRITFVKSVAAPFFYEGKVRASLLEYKFHSVPARGRSYGHLVGEELLRRGIEFDVLTWVPLHPRRLRKRGYDQARLIAEGVGEALGKKPIAVLKKIRSAPPQSRITTPEGRRANASGSYQVIDPGPVDGQRILIIDDIITTGATVSECARMLMLAGAKEVHAAAVACHRDG